MGGTELKAALLREAENRARSLWQTAEAVVEERRRAVEKEISRNESEATKRLEEAAEAERKAILFSAQQKADDRRLRATADLCERIKKLADRLLPQLAVQEGPALWTALLNELPDIAWGTVWVCPEDKSLAEQSLPGVRITEQSGLGGGLVVATMDGRIKVDNSLLCRLNRAWPDLLPKLIAEVYKRLEVDAATGSNTPC